MGNVAAWAAIGIVAWLLLDVALVAFWSRLHR